MKNNSGITVITLIITIIVIILIASITIYSGLDTVDSVRNKNASDAVNAIYLALIANEDSIPSGLNDGKMLSDCAEITKTLSNSDFEIMGLDYTTDNCTVTFNKATTPGVNTSKITYNFTYIDDLNNKFNDLIYTDYKELSKSNYVVEFDENKKVNRPVLEKEMVAINYSGDGAVKNVYIENWYNYSKNTSKLATVEYNGKTFVWIPRFAYKIQDFYKGQSYENIPTTALDIIYLRENSNNMSNNEVLQRGYTVHPAFESGETGFWIMNDVVEIETSISNAVDKARLMNSNGDEIGHLMKNSEYAAAVFLLRWLGNTEVTFGEKEFVAAVCDDDTITHDFDKYSSDMSATNYIKNIKGQALSDTPWNLQKDPVLPDSSSKYMLRDVTKGGLFYYESTNGIVDAAYRIVIDK